MVFDIPILPLAGEVHFPATELRLHISEPRDRQLIRDLEQLPEPDRRLGMVVPAAQGARNGGPSVFPTGTAGRLTEIEPLPEGRFFRKLKRTSAQVGAQVRAGFPLTPEQAILLAEGGHLEVLVNTLGAGLDLPVQRKLEQLQSPLSQRGATLLALLREGERVLDLLRPYRALAGKPEEN